MKKITIHILIALAVMSSCVRPTHVSSISDEDRHRADSIVRANRDADSLLKVLDRFIAEDNISR